MPAALFAKLREYFSPNQQFGLRMAHVLGIEIWFHWWLLIIVALHVIFYFLPWSHYESPLLHLSVYLITLPTSVLVHELGHVYMALRQGGGAERLVLLPVGGLQPCDAPPYPRRHFWVATGGILANLLVLGIAGGVCLAAGWSLLPGPEATADFHRLVVQYFVLWNTFLIIVNLIPCYPMDAGRMVQTFLWGRLASYPRASLMTLQSSKVLAILSMVAGVAILLFSLGNRKFALEHPLLNNLVTGLLLVGFLYFYEARRLELQLEYGFEEEEKGIFGYDFSQGYTSLEKSRPEARDARPSVMERRREKAKRREEEERLRKDVEVRRRVDELLEKISRLGMESLSREEQRFLKRASKHYRGSAASKDS